MTIAPQFENWMQIATRITPNEFTWDLLDELGKDTEITHHIIRQISCEADFSTKQEDSLVKEIIFAIKSGVLDFDERFLKEINPTDLIYALHKGYEEVFWQYSGI